MKRRILLIAAGLATLLAVGALALSRKSWGGIPTNGVPVFTVVRETLRRQVEAEGTLMATRSTSIPVPPELTNNQRLEWLAPDGSPVRAGEVIARIDPTQMQLDLADGLDELEIARLKSEEARRKREARSASLDLDSTLAGHQADYTKAFAPKDPTIFSRQEIIDSEIDTQLAEETVDNVKGRREVSKLQEETELAVLELDRQRAQQKIDKARRGLAALEVRVPHDGILLLARGGYGEILRTGVDVWPGTKIAEIPDPAAMQARVYILGADAAGVKAGCHAHLIIEAHPDAQVEGTVLRVDALAKRRSWNLPLEFFEAVVEPANTDLKTMKPGLGVHAEITLEDIPSALTIPPQALFQEDQKAVTFRKEGARFESVAIQIGARSLSRVQVLSGLKEGDQVAIRDPRREFSFASPGEEQQKPALPPAPGGGR